MKRVIKAYLGLNREDVPFLLSAIFLCSLLFVAGRYSVALLPMPTKTVAVTPVTRVVVVKETPVATPEVKPEPPVALLPEVEPVTPKPILASTPPIVSHKPVATPVPSQVRPAPEPIVLEETPEMKNPYRSARRASLNPGF
jgi:hypothetical protein